MPCPPGHTIYMSSCQATPYAIPYLARQYYAMPARTYHIPCQARQAILYTMPCPPSHCINHAMPARPYPIPCHAFQAKSYTMPGMPSHILYHAIPDRPHQMPCPPTITIYHTIPHAMPIRPYHIPCHAHQAIPIPWHTLQAIEYTMLFQPGYTTYHAMPTRP